MKTQGRNMNYKKFGVRQPLISNAHEVHVAKNHLPQRTLHVTNNKAYITTQN